MATQEGFSERDQRAKGLTQTETGAPTDPTQLETAVVAERIRTLYRQATPVLVANGVNACIVGACLWNTTPKTPLLAWVATVCAVTLARSVLTRQYRHSPPAPPRAKHWGRLFVLGSAATGVLWGAAALCLLTHATASGQLLLTFVIGGMCAAAAGTIASHMPAFVAFTIPALAGLALRLAQFGGSAHAAMAALIVVYQLALVAVARVNNRVLSEAFTLRFDNERLVRELTSAQTRLEDTNRTLERRVIERTEALRIQSETLRNAQRMEAVGRLAGGVAHDFNNLLTVILGNLSELMDHRQSEHDSVIALNEMRESATRGADLVRQLLLFSRQQRTIPQLLDINTVLRDMAKLLGRIAGEQHSFVLDLDATETPVRMDPTQLKHVIINLVSNARDAMVHQGTLTVATTIEEIIEPTTAIEPGTYVVLAVTDTGIGMDANTQQLIFDPFFTTKDIDKGTGLGLATVYGIVQQCGGDIHVTSEPEHGSCFRIYLPRATAATRDTEQEVTAFRTSNAFPQINPTATILLVEDEPIVRKVAKRILSREGYRVLTAESGEHALRVSAERTGRIDVLITDVIMPGMGGGQLAEQLRATRPGLRTLFMSGYSRDQTIPRDDPLRGTMFLAKPFTNESLLARVRELLAAPRGVRTSAA